MHYVINKLIFESSFDFNFKNRLDSSISIIEIDSKLDSNRANLKSTRYDSSQISSLIFKIESNR